MTKKTFSDCTIKELMGIFTTNELVIKDRFIIAKGNAYRLDWKLEDILRKSEEEEKGNERQY